jgi:hypothetical protein
VDALGEIQQRIDDLSQRLQARVNAELTLLYWQVGKILLAHDPAPLAELARPLCQEYGTVWNGKQLGYCLKAARLFCEDEIRRAVACAAPWSQLRRRMNRQEEAQVGACPPTLLTQDPLLVFLGLQRRQEVGLCALEEVWAEPSGFALVARHKRLPISYGDFCIDLLLLDRRRRHLVAVVLKQGEFESDDRDLLELYLLWLSKNEQQEGEGGPLAVHVEVSSKVRVRLFEMSRGVLQAVDFPAAWVAPERLEQHLQAVSLGEVLPGCEGHPRRW